MSANLFLLQMFKTNVIKRDKEVDRVTNEILANQPGAQIQEELTDQESKERRGSHGRERTKEGVGKSIYARRKSSPMKGMLKEPKLF